MRTAGSERSGTCESQEVVLSEKHKPQMRFLKLHSLWTLTQNECRQGEMLDSYLTLQDLASVQETSKAAADSLQLLAQGALSTP